MGQAGRRQARPPQVVFNRAIKTRTGYASNRAWFLQYLTPLIDPLVDGSPLSRSTHQAT